MSASFPSSAYQAMNTYPLTACPYNELSKLGTLYRMNVHAWLFSCVWLFVTLWVVGRQAPQSMGFSRQGYCSELSCPPPGDLSNARIKPASPVSPARQADSWLAEPSVMLENKGKLGPAWTNCFTHTLSTEHRLFTSAEITHNMETWRLTQVTTLNQASSSPLVNTVVCKCICTLPPIGCEIFVNPFKCLIHLLCLKLQRLHG